MKKIAINTELEYYFCQKENIKMGKLIDKIRQLYIYDISFKAEFFAEQVYWLTIISQTERDIVSQNRIISQFNVLFA